MEKLYLDNADNALQNDLDNDNYYDKINNDITPIAFIVSSTVIVNDEKLKPTITLYML